MIVEETRAGSIVDIDPANRQFAADLIRAFHRSPKRIPCKYLYDANGSALFEEICGLEEYYLTRAEHEILNSHIRELGAFAGAGEVLIEFGSGSSTKTRILLDNLDVSTYVPVDIARAQLNESAAGLAEDHPNLKVLPVCADYTRRFQLPPSVEAVRDRLVFFPGSTIGNFERSEAVRFLRRIGSLCGPDGGLLIGVDLKKSPGRLEAAYNDSRRVTAKFNLNVLARSNRELNANFDLGKFEHRAIYNRDRGRIEMLLISRADQIVRIVDDLFFIADGEEIVTEHCYKYSVDEFRDAARKGGFEPSALWTDAAQFFSVWYLRPSGGTGDDT